MLIEAALACLGTSNGIDSLLRCVFLPEVLSLRTNSKMELTSTLLQPQSLLVLTHSAAKLGSHRPRDCSNNDLTLVDVQTRGLVGEAARSVRLPTRRSTAGARVRPLLLAARRICVLSAVSHSELMSSVALSKTDRQHGSS